MSIMCELDAVTSLLLLFLWSDQLWLLDVKKLFLFFDIFSHLIK